jgi:hypothetical protein
VALEERTLLSLSIVDLTQLADPPPILGQIVAASPPILVPTVQLDPQPSYADDPGLDPPVPLPASPPPESSPTPGPGGALHPLSALPALSSLPGARDSLYLNFLGDFTSSFGAYSNITTPVFDQDGDPTTFSDGELAAIQKVWSYVAEDYAPFNINVTTVPPANMAHGVTEKVDIGGDGQWTGSSVGGLTYVNDFTNTTTPNIAFVFAQNLDDGNPKYTGDAISHEAGHGFGLLHQSTYSGSTKTEYNTGPGDGTAPIMGNSYGARRSLWWDGTSSLTPTTIQDDMSVLAGPINGFGYRPDSDANTAATATPLSLQNGDQVDASGLIVHTSDMDYYSFVSGAGPVSFTVSVPADVSNLAPKLELLDASGQTVIAEAGPSPTDFSANVSVTLASSGTYLLMVASNGGYGNVGHYSLSGTVSSPSNNGGATPPTTGTGTGAGISPLSPPSSLSATAVSTSQVNLVWTDPPTGAIGYSVERSTNYATWARVGSLAPRSTQFVDTTVVPNASYYYRVEAFNSSGASAASQVTYVRTPRIRVAHGRGGRTPPRITKHRATLHASTAREAPGRSRPRAAAASLPGSLGTTTAPSAIIREFWTTDQVLLAWPDVCVALRSFNLRGSRKASR